jgi:hypothetical protein
MFLEVAPSAYPVERPDIRIPSNTERILLEILQRLVFDVPAAYTVAAGWLTLALLGRWRPEKSWIDRLGRVLGVGWIIANVLQHSVPILIGI